MMQSCLAYIDPGTGSILLQFLIGALVGAGLFFRQSLFAVANFFRSGRKKTTTSGPPPTNP